MRFILILVWVSITFSYRLIGLIASPVFPNIDRYFRRTAFRACAKGVLKIAGIRPHVRGARPSAPFYLVSNHISFFDVFLIASELGCVFVSKSELGQWPVFGFIARRMNTILINREDIRDTHRVNEEIKNVMNDGLGIVVFAESRVSQTGELLPFKPALLQPAIASEMPVHYASVHYATPYRPSAAQELILWKDGVGVIRHFLNVASLPSCEATLVFGERPIEASDRKVLATALHSAVQAQYTPIAPN